MTEEQEREDESLTRRTMNHFRVDTDMMAGLSREIKAVIGNMQTLSDLKKHMFLQVWSRIESAKKVQ